MGIDLKPTVSILPSLDAQSHISFEIRFEPYLRELFPECCLPDGSFTCPECGGLLEVDPVHGKCLGSCPEKTRVKNVWTLLTVKQGWESTGGGKRAINHLAARVGVAVAWERAKKTKDRQRELLTAALSYAARGWKVFPVWNIGRDGRCACGGQRDCKPGKHPATRNGLNDACADRTQLLEWWSRWPEANVGIATGAASGFFVLDVDGDAGQISLSGLEEQHGKLPDTVEAITGSGGRHVLFRCPHDLKIHNSAGSIAQGLDIRGTGGFIVAAPSNHYSGGSYVWEVASQPDDVEIADAPQWLLNLMRNAPRTSHLRDDGRTQARGTSGNGFVLPEQIDEGARNDTLLRYARSLHGKRLSDHEIRTLVTSANEAYCKPPVEQEEVEAVIRQGITMADRERPQRGKQVASEPKVSLYREDDFIREEGTVWIAPDEASADALIGFGVMATAIPGGLSEWSKLIGKQRPPQIPPALQERHIFMLVGPSEEDRGAAERIASDLYPQMHIPSRIAYKLKILEMPELADGTTLPAFIGEHGAEAIKTRLRELAKSTKEYRPSPTTENGRPIKFIFWSDLMGMDFPKPKWLVEGLIPAEGVSIIAGKPKIGKSWFVQQLSYCHATGKAMLEAFPSTKGLVLHFALEDTPRRFQDRLRMMLNGSQAPPNALFCNACPPLPSAIKFIEDRLEEYPGISLVVVDTLAKVRSPRKKQESQYDHDYRDMGAFQSLAIEHGIAVVILHHQRKEEASDVFDTVHGSQGIGGSADMTLVLTKQDRLKPEGTLDLTGRDGETRKIALAFDSTTGCWSYLGDGAEADTTPERRQILAVLREAGKPLSIAEIAELCPGKKYKAVQKTINRMLKKELLAQSVVRGKFILSPEAFRGGSLNSSARQEDDEGSHDTHFDWPSLGNEEIGDLNRNERDNSQDGLYLDHI